MSRSGRRAAGLGLARAGGLRLTVCAAFLVGALTAEAAPGTPRAVPFAPRAEQGAATLFTELNADAIGVGSYANTYSSPDMWGAKWQQYLLGPIGTGVAIGDVDGDEWPDVFVVSKDEANKLFRNLGGWKFADITDAAGLTKAAAPGCGCAFADVDNDGDLDLYVCYVGGANQLWLNDGRGHFEERASAWGVDVNSGTNMASFADYDRDGDLDLYVQMNSIVTDGEYHPVADRLFENRGGKFVDVTAAAGIHGVAHGHSATWWDYDEDGWPDLYVTRDYEPLDRLYRNNRDGTFTDVISAVMPMAPYYAMSADVGDIDNDGHPDLWVTDMPATTRVKQMRTVGNHEHVLRPTPPGQVNQYVKNVLALNVGPAAYADIGYLSGLDRTDWTWASRLADLDNDGWVDAFVSNGMFRSFGDGDLGVRRVTDRDWVPVFKPSPVLNEANLAFRNERDLTFRSVGPEWGLDKFGISFGAAFGDLDRNGSLDLVVVNAGQKLSVYRNNERHAQTIEFRLQGTRSSRFGIGAKVTVHAGDLKQVKGLSLSRGYMSTDEPILHFGLGDRPRVDRVEVDWPSGAHQELGGLSAGARYLVEEPAEAAHEREGPVPREDERTLFRPMTLHLPARAARKEAEFADETMQPLLPFLESRLGGAVAVGDIDGDGVNDLVLSGAAGQSAIVLVNRGGGKFEDRTSLDLEDDFVAEDRGLALVDVDGDGARDLLVASGGIELNRGDPFYAARLYHNEAGELRHDAAPALAAPALPSSVLAVGDYDGDGRPDAFIGGGTLPGQYPYTAPSRLWHNVKGSFVRVDATIAAGLVDAERVGGASFADVDGDGALDLVVAREWSTPEIWRNAGPGFERLTGVFNAKVSSGLWGAIAVADFDQDGRADIAAGNLGLNTPHHATPAAPLRLWFSPASEERVKLLQTIVEAGQEWPVETKRRLQPVFPRQLPASLSFERYANSTVEMLFPRRAEEGYRMLEINEPRSGVFYQREAGRFVFVPFPMFAQSGRVMGLLVADLNADRVPDIVLSLEPPTPEPRSGRFEKGCVLVLLNHGRDGFEAVLPRHSGLAIDGSPRGLAWGDLDQDGSPEIVVTLSEGLPRAFYLNAPRPH